MQKIQKNIQVKYKIDLLNIILNFRIHKEK